MAQREVTLSGTSVGVDISTLDIYHTSQIPANFITGVTRNQLINGITFLDDDSNSVYI